LIGDYVSKTEVHHAYLMRLARTKEASVAERAQAEALAAKVLNDRFDRLQSLGYVPLQPQQIIGDVVHHLTEDEGRSYGELRTQLTEIEQVAQQTGNLTPELTAELKRMLQRIDHEELTLQVQQLEHRQQEIQPKENSDE